MKRKKSFLIFYDFFFLYHRIWKIKEKKQHIMDHKYKSSKMTFYRFSNHITSHHIFFFFLFQLQVNFFIFFLLLFFRLFSAHNIPKNERKKEEEFDTILKKMKRKLNEKKTNRKSIFKWSSIKARIRYGLLAYCLSLIKSFSLQTQKKIRKNRRKLEARSL